MAKLTEKQKRFCEEYVKDANAKQAAIRAGYSGKTAYSIGNENLNKPELRAYMDEVLDKMQSERVADAQEIIEYLTSVMRGETKEEVVSLNKGAAVKISVDTSSKDRLKAAEMLGKVRGIFQDKAKIELNVPVIFEGEDEIED